MTRCGQSFIFFSCLMEYLPLAAYLQCRHHLHIFSGGDISDLGHFVRLPLSQGLPGASSIHRQMRARILGPSQSSRYHSTLSSQALSIPEFVFRCPLMSSSMRRGPSRPIDTFGSTHQTLPRKAFAPICGQPSWRGKRAPVSTKPSSSLRILEILFVCLFVLTGESGL